MTPAKTRYLILTASLCLADTPLVVAEPAATPAASSAASPVIANDNLEEIVVQGVNLEDQVSPLQRKVTSVYGLELSVLDTPRAVTEINAAQIRDLSIIDVEDFVKVVSNAYTNDQFGGANVPFLRGQSAEVFQNGMLRTPRSDGQPLSFNSVEGFDIVKGPAGVVYGPTGNVGGYVNLVTKRPSFDGQHEVVSVTYGEYSTKKTQLDITGPISDTLAYRVSYEYDHSGSYYRFGYVHSSDVYAALRWLPDDKLTVDFNTEFYSAHYTENTGINRPTQQLIDNGLYYTGTGVSPYTGPGQDPRNFLSVIDVTGAVPINRRDQLVAPTDHDQGTNFQAQLDATYNASDWLTIANKGYFEDYSQLQLEYAQRYFNDIDESYNFEDRFEVRMKFGGNQLIGGLSYRFMHVLAYGDFYNEYLNATDITGNPANFPINTNLYGVVALPSNATYFATPGASYAGAAALGYPNSIANTQDQNSHQIGVFLQDIYAVTDQISLLIGLRGDLIHESLTDPLPPPGFAPAHDTATMGESAADLSITYKPLTWLTTYLTADYNQSPVTTTGGGFAAFTGDTINRSDFKINNFLYEGGVKAALLDNSLFLSSAGFFQKRAQTDQFENVEQIDSYGFEFEANYQPTRNFSATMAYGYLDARLHAAGGSLAFTGNVYDAFAAPYGTGVGSPNFTSLPAQDYRLPAVPSNLFSAFTKYRTDLGLGASMSVVVSGPIDTSYIGNVRIPTQYQWDGSIFYETTKWSVRANFYNLTNQKNWVAEAGAQGNDLITAVMPFHYQVSGTYRF